MSTAITPKQLTELSDYILDNSSAIELPEGDESNGHIFRTDYSGRGMYGKACVGLVIEGVGDLFEIALLIGEWLGHTSWEDGEPPYELAEAFKKASTDSMGYHTIVYWPRIQVEE